MEELADRDTTKRADGGGGVKQREENHEEADVGDNMDVFLRDASATRGIHCRLGMDGVGGVLRGRLDVAFLPSLFLTTLHGCHAATAARA